MKNKIICSLLIIFLGLNLFCKAQKGDIVSDSLALVALYDSTGGPGWTVDTNWTTGPLTTWHGITLLNGRVDQVRLINNNLNGKIPPQIGDLDSLRTLDLFMNSLYDSIPKELWNLKKLNTLWLSSNNLIGNIPSEIKNLKELYQLGLENNNLNGNIPIELTEILSLQFLILGGNQLTGNIPPEIKNLSLLGYLKLSLNNLTGSIPPELGDLSNLTDLYLNNNNLTGTIPPELSNLSKLKKLVLYSNQLTGTIPSELGMLNNLESFELLNNQLQGEIPSELGNLNNLISFGVAQNNLTGEIPLGILESSRLFSFTISYNQFTGSVPSQISNVVSLNYIQVNDNQFDSLPDLNGLINLQGCWAQNNKFTFEDLENNIHQLTEYAPQDSIQNSDSMYFSINDTLKLETFCEGKYNNYQWTKDGLDIIDGVLYTGTNDSVLYINSPALIDTGSYACKVTNDTVTGLTIHRRPVKVLPTVHVSGISDVTSCVDDTLIIEYKTVELGAGNILTVELSDKDGNFENPIEIGSVSTTDSIGIINAPYIPDTMATGAGYRIRISATNPVLTGKPSEELTIVNRTLIKPVLNILTDSTICEGQTVQLNMGDMDYVNYTWFLNNSAIVGADSNNYEASQQGEYFVKIHDACNDSLSSDTVYLTVNDIPLSPTIVADGPTEIQQGDSVCLSISAQTGCSYTWKLNYTPLSANGTVFCAKEFGSYTVEVLRGLCKSTSANSILVTEATTTSIEQTITKNIRISPNPTNGKINIIIEEGIYVHRVKVLDLLGKVVYEKGACPKYIREFIEVDISGQPTGIYLVYIDLGNESKTLRFMKK